MIKFTLVLLCFFSVINSTEVKAMGFLKIKNYNKIGIIKKDSLISSVVVERDEKSIYVVGEISRPFGRDFSWTKITAYFLNGQGEIIAQNKTRVSYFNTSRSLARGGTFVVDTKYDPQITNCKIEVQW